MRSRLARLGRAVVELGLDALGWPWSRRVSRWIDALVIAEERS
jgi:hypothetical protein